MNDFLEAAIDASRMAGAFLKDHFYDEKAVNEASQFDVKIELDVKTQKKIEGHLLGLYPDHAIYGEEGLTGDQSSEYQWIIDPIDGTVNYFYGIPHFCVSIALRHQGELIVGVIYDPMMDELWTATKGGKALLNGREISVSKRTQLNEAIVFISRGRTTEVMDDRMQRFAQISTKVRKMRLTGSGALAMVYVATGRFDAYVESSTSLWDIAAGKLIVECAGGAVNLEAKDNDKYSITAWNGLIPIEAELN